MNKKSINFWLILFGILILGRFIYLQLSSVNLDEIQNLNGNKIQRIGHGGSGRHALFPFQPLPWNSELSIRLALDTQLDGIEVDVQLSADSVLVLFHDHLLEESSNLKGSIINLNWEQIQQGEYQLGAPYDWLQHEKIISLEKALDIMLEQDTFPLLYLDFHAENFKHGKTAFFMVPAFCRALDRLLERKKIPLDKVYLISMFPEVLEHFVQMKNKPILVYEETIELKNALVNAKAYGIKHLQVKRQLLSKENVEEAHRKGFFISTHRGRTRWGLSQTIKLNVDAIHANGIHNLIDLLEE